MLWLVEILLQEKIMPQRTIRKGACLFVTNRGKMKDLGKVRKV